MQPSLLGLLSTLIAGLLTRSRVNPFLTVNSSNQVCFKTICVQVRIYILNVLIECNLNLPRISIVYGVIFL